MATGIRRYFYRPRNEFQKNPKTRSDNVEVIGDALNVPTTVGVGRKTIDDNFMLFGQPSQILLPPPSAEDDWRTFTLDANSFDRLPADRILELLADLSPEVSKAVWDYLRMANPGWDFRVYKPGTQTSIKNGELVVRETLDNWGITGGSLDTIFGRCNLAAFLRGAMFTETVFDTDRKTSIALVTPDPISVRFERLDRGALGAVWQLGQYQQGSFVEITSPTVQYIPIDPLPGKPYGRAMASPAIFTGLFMLGMLHDLRRVIAQQGYPRIDVSIDVELLMKMAPMDARGNPQKLKEYTDKVVSDIKSAYAKLEPTDAFVHLSLIKINNNVGVMDSDSLGSVSGIITALERMSIRALKTMPLLMAVMDGASDANSNRQWEIQAQGIKSIQHLLEHMMQRSLGLVLRANAIQADVIWRFSELRSSEALRDAQTETLQIQNSTNKWAMGWYSHEQASMEATGQKPDKKDGPRIMPKAPTNEPPANANDTVGKSDGTPTEPATTKAVGAIAPGNLRIVPSFERKI